MEGGAIAAIVLSILLVILGLAFGGLFKKYKELEGITPAFIGPRRTWFAWILQQFAYTRILFMYMPNAILMFGFIADVLSQNYRYSAASILGLSSVFLNAIGDMILTKIFSEAPALAAVAAPAVAAVAAPAVAAVAAPAVAAVAAPAVAAVAAPVAAAAAPVAAAAAAAAAAPAAAAAAPRARRRRPPTDQDLIDAFNAAGT